MAPLTRFRVTEDQVPTPLMKEYYSQRAAVPGTLIITDETFISATCDGFPHALGLWREDQIAAWRIITDKVHTKSCYIFCQLFTMGRAADFEVARKEGFAIVAPSVIPMEEGAAVPQAMTIEDIKQTARDFVDASKNPSGRDLTASKFMVPMVTSTNSFKVLVKNTPSTNVSRATTLVLY